MQKARLEKRLNEDTSQGLLGYSTNQVRLQQLAEL